MLHEHGGDIYGGREIKMDFSVNTNPLGMPENLKQALIDNIDSFSRYPDPHCRELTGAIADYEGILPEHILCGNGAADLIFRLCLALRPERALICAPTFSEYENAVNAGGGSVEYHELRQDEGFMLTGRILEEISGQMVFICHPNNPTGRLTNPALLEKILERCAQTGGLLVVDECFLEFTRGRSMKSFLEYESPLVILKAFTKNYAMAGLRLGYLLCSDADILRRIKKCGQHWSVSVPAQTAGLAALREEGWMCKTRAVIETQREYLIRTLEDAGLTVCPSDANYLLIEAHPGLFEALQEKGVLVRSCHNFRGLGERFIRICVGLGENNEKFIGILKEALHG